MDFDAKITNEIVRPRTRYLAVLDPIVRADRQGAIDDMLQVLREQGVIVDVHTLTKIDTFTLDRYSPDPGFHRSIERGLVRDVAEEATPHIRFDEWKRTSPREAEKRATLTVVRKRP